MPAGLDDNGGADGHAAAMSLVDLVHIVGTRVAPYGTGSGAGVLWPLVAWGIAGTVVAIQRLARSRAAA